MKCNQKFPNATVKLNDNSLNQFLTVEFSMWLLIFTNSVNVPKIRSELRTQYHILWTLTWKFQLEQCIFSRTHIFTLNAYITSKWTSHHRCGNKNNVLVKYVIDYIMITRKSSCVNARGIPPARGRKILTPPADPPLGPDPPWLTPPPSWPPPGPDLPQLTPLKLTPPGTWPPLADPPPRCEQTENVTFPHPSDAGGKNRGSNTRNTDCDCDTFIIDFLNTFTWQNLCHVRGH